MQCIIQTVTHMHPLCGLDFSKWISRLFPSKENILSNRSHHAHELSREGLIVGMGAFPRGVSLSVVLLLSLAPSSTEDQLPVGCWAPKVNEKDPRPFSTLSSTMHQWEDSRGEQLTPTRGRWRWLNAFCRMNGLPQARGRETSITHGQSEGQRCDTPGCSMCSKGSMSEPGSL